MITRHRPPEPGGARELLVQRRREVARVEEPVFGSFRASAWSAGTRSERWIRSSGASANGVSARVDSPQRRERRRRAWRARDRSRGSPTVKRPDSRNDMPAREPQHRREQRVVHADEHDARGRAGERGAARRGEAVPSRGSVCEAAQAAIDASV